MGGVTGQATFALDGLGDALQQLVLGVEQRLEFTGQRMNLQRLEGVDTAPHQGIPHTVERHQALANAQPQQAQAAQQCHADRHRRRQQDRQVEGFTLHLAVGGGDQQVATGQGKTAPAHAVDDLVAKAAAARLQPFLRSGMTARQDLATQGADLASHATRHIQLFGAQMRAPADAGQARHLLGEPGHHARRSHQALVEGKHHLVAQIVEHPGGRQHPDQHKSGAQLERQAQTQAHHGVLSPPSAVPRR